MAEISAKDVMKLRQQTGLSMMACKKALQECDGDAQKAEDHLRKQLKGKMDTRTDRAAGEGRVAIAKDGNAAVILEVRAETDFTAKNEQFAEACGKIAELALSQPAGSVSPTDEMTALIDNIRVSTGENCSIARCEKIESAGSFGTYVHHNNRVAVLVEANGDISDQTLSDLCMHITAAVPRPLGITTNDIPSDLVEKEKKFRTEQAIESGKPQEIAEKMVEGGMRKFYEEVALLEQGFVKDPSTKIKAVIGDANLVSFRRWEVGED